MRKLIVLFVAGCLLDAGPVAAQPKNFVSRYINKLINDTSHSGQPQFLVYPTLAYAPETSWEIGLSSLYVYYANNDTANRLSEVNAFTFYTLEKQYGAWLDHALYSDKSTWFILGRLRYQNFPLLYYGIGAGTAKDYLARVDATQLQIKERLLRSVKQHFYVGLEMDYQRLGSVQFQHADGAPPFDAPVGSAGSANLGLGTSIIYDNRHNVLNVRDGFFSELSYLRYSPSWGSTFRFTQVLSDSRLYRPVGPRNVLAAQLLGQFNLGQVPFNQMALLGGESMMRGYYTGRFRDKNLVAAQAEFRMLPLPLGFSKRLGATVFAGTGTVFNQLEDFKASDLALSGGLGLRFLLFPKKDIFTRLDLAFTKEGKGFYIFIGEAF